MSQPPKYREMGFFFLFVVPIADVGCQKKCPAMVKVGLSRLIPKADRGIGKRVSQIVLKMSGKFVQSGFGK